MTPRFFITLLCLCTVVAGLTGCGPHNLSNTGLAVSVTAIERHEDGSAAITVLIDNPTVYPFNIKRATHKLFLNDREVATLETEESLGIPPQSGGTQIVALPAGKLTSATIGECRYRLETMLDIRRYGDDYDHTRLAGAGSVVIRQK